MTTSSFKWAKKIIWPNQISNHYKNSQWTKNKMKLQLNKKHVKKKTLQLILYLMIKIMNALLLILETLLG